MPSLCYPSFEFAKNANPRGGYEGFTPRSISTCLATIGGAFLSAATSVAALFYFRRKKEQTMKKAVSIILALVMCLSMCACAGGTKTKEIELTLDNYDDYLKIWPYISLPHDIARSNTRYFDAMDGTGCIVMDYSSYICIGVSVKGISDNFSYSDITLEVKATGRYIAVDQNQAYNSCHTTVYQNQTFSQYIECKLDIAGDGTGISTGKVRVPGGLVIPYHSAHPSTDFTFEIVKISGTVTPA